jgi:AcrR family transcriptional regulator
MSMTRVQRRDPRHLGMPVERLTPERRRAMTRAHLLDAAAEVFAERGFYGATLDQIADAAGFSKGAVYSNFASKDDLFLALIQRQSESILQDYADVENPWDVAALADVYLRRKGDLTKEWALVTEFDLYALRNPEVHDRLRQFGSDFRAHIAELVQRRCDEAGVEPPLPAERIATLYTAIFDGLWRQKALDPDAVPDDLAAQALVLISDAIEALGTPKKARRKKRA